MAHLPHVDEFATVPTVPEIAFIARPGKGRRIDKGLVLFSVLLLIVIHRLLLCGCTVLRTQNEQPIQGLVLGWKLFILNRW